MRSGWLAPRPHRPEQAVRRHDYREALGESLGGADLARHAQPPVEQVKLVDGPSSDYRWRMLLQAAYYLSDWFMITRLHVRNFKSLRQIDLSLGPFNVLVGPNMSGKSNILDVLHFLHQIFFPQAGTLGISYALAQRGGVSEVLWKGGDSKLISIALEANDDADPGTTYKYLLELIVGPGDFVTTQSESLKLLRAGEEFDLILNQGGASQFKNADGKVVGGIGSPGVSALQYASPDWDGYRFTQWLKLWRFYHLVPSAMKESSSMSLGEALTEDGGNLSAWLLWLQSHSPEGFFRLNEVLHDLFPEIVQIRAIPTQDGKVHLAATEIGLKRPTFVWALSDGFLALAALLSLIYAPPGLSGTVFCIEEPENHLHPRLLETLVGLLRQVRQEVVDSKGALPQILCTTQSPYLVNQFSLDESVWVERKNGETTVFRPADKVHLKKLIEDKDLGLGDLMFTGVLGEGK
jgi:predicted ATPase